MRFLCLWRATTQMNNNPAIAPPTMAMRPVGRKLSPLIDVWLLSFPFLFAFPVCGVGAGGEGVFGVCGVGGDGVTVGARVGDAVAPTAVGA